MVTRRQEGAERFYEALETYAAVEQLIADGEAEGLYLECKAPGGPHLGRDQKAQLAEATSGFSNTSGGVIVWGVSTTKHAHSGLDILTQAEPIANCSQFARHVDRLLPTLTTPPVVDGRTRFLLRAPGDTRGLVATYVPQRPGDPTQSAIDSHFYFRSGDQFVKAPYDMIRRLFSATTAPDLTLILDPRLVTTTPEGDWRIPIALGNNSTAAARDIIMSVQVINAEVCESIGCTSGLVDVSHLNPGQKLLTANLTGVVHRGLNHVAGILVVRMGKGRRLRRVIRLRVRLFADRMRAREWELSVQLAKKGFSARGEKESYVY